MVFRQKNFLVDHCREYYKCNDRRDCEDGSDELGCDENVLRRLTEVVDQGEDYFLGEVSEADIESSTKYELFESIHTAWQAPHAFRNSSLFEAADVAYSKGAYTYDVRGGWGEGGFPKGR